MQLSCDIYERALLIAEFAGAIALARAHALQRLDRIAAERQLAILVPDSLVSESDRLVPNFRPPRFGTRTL